jgi:hypothetical protein
MGPPVIPDSRAPVGTAEEAVAQTVSQFIARTTGPALYGPPLHLNVVHGHVVAVHMHGQWRYAHLVNPADVLRAVQVDDAVRAADQRSTALSRLARQLN